MFPAQTIKIMGAFAILEAHPGCGTEPGVPDMAVFLSSTHIHSELHSLRASSVLHTNPVNLQCVTLYQNPDGHYKRAKLQFDISWDQRYSKKKKTLANGNQYCWKKLFTKIQRNFSHVSNIQYKNKE